jgi:hypothetical protein
MTGYPVRVFRDGTWQSLEIDELTDIELEELAERFPEGGWNWAMGLAKWVRDNVRKETVANEPPRSS